MIYLYTFLIIALSSFLWRVRGGLDIWKGDNVPMNKIWYAVAFSVYSWFYFDFTAENLIIAFIACYTSYQLYGWGLYLGRLLNGGELKPNLVQYRECELIDDLLYSLHITIKGNKCYLYQYPKLFGFLGTTLTGLIITFLWGLFLNSIGIMLSGLAMGICYWLGSKLYTVKSDNKFGWNWGEWIFGAYMGLILAWGLLW